MYSTLLPIHSLFRWLVLLSLLYAIYRAYRGWLTQQPFTQLDDRVRHRTATIVHIQWLLGIILYFISPAVDYLWHNFREAVHQQDARFFGMEHASMMFIAVIVISLASARSKRQATDRQKFKTMAIGFSIGLLIILLSIPWPFSPLVSRPWLRGW
ncbi:MAG: hypothetical protein RIG62_25940 [Cyclobacteriaceae bacterium]